MTPALQMSVPDQPLSDQGQGPKVPLDLSSHLRTLVERGDTTVKELAFWWDVDERFVRKVLADEKPLPDYRIQQLPIEVQQLLAIEWCHALRLTVGRRAALTLALEALAILARDEPAPRKRMAKADLAEDVKPKARRA